MNRTMAVASLLIVSGTAFAQSASRLDVMGPHTNFGRGCSACHSMHDGDLVGKSASLNNPPLWGESGLNLYGAGIRSYLTAKTPERNGILNCLSCHDGNYASKATMKNRIFEPLPEAYGRYSSPPTFIEESSAVSGLDFSEHPVGLDTQMGCGEPTEWDCTVTSSGVVMDGPYSGRFAAAYGLFNEPHLYEGKEVLVCTTCHNPHSQNVIGVTEQTESKAFPRGTYPTTFFLRAPYTPASASVTSNLNAQYCRQCHADLSNEMNGGTFGTAL